MAYCTRSDIEAVAGRKNIDAWADVSRSDDEATIITNIDEAIAWSDAQIDAMFRNGPYTIPFSPVPTRVKWWSAKLSAVRLYGARGLQDDGRDEWAGRLTRSHDRVMQEVRIVSSGSERLLTGALSHTGPTAPVGG